MASKCLALRSLSRVTQQVRQYSAPADRSIPAAKQQYVPTSGTYPKGFLAGSAFAGVKASNTKYNDIALVVSETPCEAAAVFTKNAFKAAPVVLSKGLLSQRRSQGFKGVIVNSGCANAVTGKLGLEHAEQMSRKSDACSPTAAHEEATDDPANIPQTLVMSTGVIGQRLPIDRILNAIPKAHESLGATHEHWLGAAQAICTTDTFPKLISRTFTLPSHPDTTYTIAGMTKGAGMIAPNMATLLGIICTDALVDPSSIRGFLRRACTASFNCISIDGDTSTNDTVALLANGAAAPSGTSPVVYKDASHSGPPSKSNGELSEDAAAFLAVLRSFATDLAKLVVRDGEGATKFVTIRVRADATMHSPRKVAKSIANSSLVKTALYGKDANWGRILCAIGYANLGQEAHPSKPLLSLVRTSVSFIPSDGSPELKLLVRGEPEEVDEARAKEILEMEDLEIMVRLEDDPPMVDAHGKESPRKSKDAVFYTCDFSHEYVTINGDYRT